MKTLSKAESYVMIAGAIMLLVGIGTHATGMPLAMYLFAVGTVLFAAMQIKGRCKTDNFVIKRLQMQQTIGALLLVVSAALLILGQFNFAWAGHNEWMVCLTIASVLELYTAFRLPQEYSKERKKRK